MGVFSQKSKIKALPPTIRVEKVVVAAPPKPKPKPQLSHHRMNGHSNGGNGSSNGLRASSASRASPASGFRKSASPYISSADERRGAGSGGNRKRKLTMTARRSPASDRVEFGKDDSGDEDDDWEDAIDARKRRRRAMLNGDRRVDPNRKLRHESLRATSAGEETEKTKEDGETDGAEEKRIRMIHAADVASLALKCVPSFSNASGEEVAVELQYPGTAQRERYELVWGKDKIDAVKDIIRVVKHVAETYLTDEEARPFLDQNTGIVRQLERASNPNVLDLAAFKEALRDYNERLLVLVCDGTVARNLDARHDLPTHLIAFILDQVYDRTVAQKVELLSKYENGTDNVYGELLHPFVSNIFAERLRMTSDQVFVDLGSGVGNVVLQAALEIGCESWGDEMMENACNLAESQQREFAARCRLWGIRPGKVFLERGDFRTNPRIQEVLKRADVVLVNNQAFTSQLNDDLVRMFLDLKTGCKIISLKNFVHDYKSAAYNVNDVGSTILDVEDLTYPEGYVSWTGAAGTFCISTRK